MDALYELKKVLEKQIEEVTKKNDISPAELERLDKAVDIIKDIETICAMKDYGDNYEEMDGGYSGRYPYYMRDAMPRNSYRGGGSYDYGPSMYGDASYRRGRDAMTGRYVSRDPYSYDRGGYSGHANREDLRMDLREMMNNAKSDKERMAIQNFLDQWKE